MKFGLVSLRTYATSDLCNVGLVGFGLMGRGPNSAIDSIILMHKTDDCAIML